jgi:hypothetical protein
MAALRLPPNASLIFIGRLYHRAVFAASSHAFFAISEPLVDNLEIGVANAGEDNSAILNTP